MAEENDGWKRPGTVNYPTVWSKFEGRKEIEGVIPKFWIQDVPEDQFKIVVDYMVNGFANDEPLCTYSKLTSDAVSIDECRQMWATVLRDKVGLICYMENPDPSGQPIIAGMNVTHIKTKNEDVPKIEGKIFAMIMDTFHFLSEMKNEFEALQQDLFLSAVGLYVLPKFRGQGVGLELLKAREPLCKALGIKASITVFTAIGSQMLAARCGFRELSVISYADLEKVNPRLRYPGIEEHTTDLKCMYKIYQ